MPPRNADERLARALIVELFLTMAEQQAEAELRHKRAMARRSAMDEHDSPAEDWEGDPAGLDGPPCAD